MNKKIVLLCSACYPTTVLYNYINGSFEIDHVIEEKPMRGLALAKRRFRKLGFFRVTGQIAFSFLVVPFLNARGRKRISELKRKYAFNESPVPGKKITRFNTVNDASCIQLLQQIDPAVVLVSGTRIISKKVLESCKAEFINMHAGITPAYRGVHGGYWAVANKDDENFGVTVHRVDKGIDTGEILYQQRIPVTSNDNYATYPYLQLGEGLPLVRKAIEDVFTGGLKPQAIASGRGRLWYHPTILQYFFYRKK